MITTTTFIGIDLAWKSERNPTGVAVLQGDRQGARLTTLSTIYPEGSVAEFVAASATADTVVAIDAPLIIINETGQRVCETAVGKRYGSREASCHTTNLRLYPGASSVALTAELASHGFVHVDPMNPQPNGRMMAEVYPHAAMVALWNLPKTIKYKRGSALEHRKGLTTLRTYLSLLTKAEPPLHRSSILSELLTAELNQLSGRKRKDHEDQLDALFCAYLAYYFWYWAWERNELFGNLESGYILNPTLQAGDIGNDDSPNYRADSRFTDHTSLSATAYTSITNDYTPLITQAHQLARPIKPSDDCSAGSVASVIISRSGKTYTGICLDFACSLGFCAEHAAIAEMLKAHESVISLVVAVNEHGAVLPPCGRCREMMWQLNATNKDALIILAHDRALPLGDLLPFR
jgi:predicted RNase H-like nuclease/cytidine deaminase